ncbi:MAG TPA: penicillin-binding transpeptidase domain-containing protein [Streptosporangiaceae bacterium]
MGSLRGKWRTFARSRRAAGTGTALVVLGTLLSACSSGASPQTTASAYLAAWARQDWTAMRQQAADPPADFVAVNSAAFTGLRVRQASFSAGTLQTSGSTAKEPVTERLNVAGLGTITIRPELQLEQRSGKWLVNWSPATIAPQLRAGDRLVLQTTWPARAQITGAGGAALTAQAQQVTIGVEGLLVKNAASLSAALVQAGATAQQAQAAIAAAKAHPTFFEPVFTVSRARYDQLKPTLYPLPGTVFQAASAVQPVTPGLASGLVGTTGPVTAQELSSLGPAYDAQSIVGQTGLEQAAERQLAGSPGATAAVVSASGAPVATLATLPSHPGTAVSTTIDPKVQQAAEAALSGVKKSASLVAVNATTGAVLAAANANAGGFNQAVDGGFPPGSTFKVITSTALIGHGLTPSSAASCPPTATVQGQVFHNAEGEAPVNDLLHAFAESCNTAFIGLATHDLSASDFPSTAAMFGLGRTPQMGVPASGGSVPQPSGPADLAATSIGQGRVLASPLNMAMVAAAADTGAARAPRLVAGAADDAAAPRPLPGAVVTDLHQMMAQVVASGTAAGQGLPAGTYAKTGTAEYGTAKPLKVDAWLIGFKGDIAFAVLVVNAGADGGPTDGPIAAKFLSGL